jgi:membrane-associated phospholipid phosphatase
MPEQSQHYLAKAFSAILHPLMMPFYLSYVCLFVEPMSPFISIKLKLVYLGIATIAFVTIPALILTLLKSLGFISSIQLKDRKERTFPMLLVAISYYIGIYLLNKTSAPWFLVLTINGVLLSIIAVSIVSRFWKISAHATGIGGALATIVLMSIAFHTNLTDYACSIALLAGGLGWARLHLKQHTITQVLVGFITGLCFVPIPFLIKFM